MNAYNGKCVYAHIPSVLSFHSESFSINFSFFLVFLYFSFFFLCLLNRTKNGTQHRHWNTPKVGFITKTIFVLCNKSAPLTPPTAIPRSPRSQPKIRSHAFNTLLLCPSTCSSVQPPHERSKTVTLLHTKTKSYIRIPKCPYQIFISLYGIAL